MKSGKPSVLIATQNPGKLAEFSRILGEEIEVEGLDGLDVELPPEGAESYKANAEEKARYVARRTGRVTLGDDSGLEVRALGGRPGVTSARFAGEPPSDARNIQFLLEELERSGTNDRSARFVCWLALADQHGLITSVEGTCDGMIAREPTGTNGFGYDPVFRFPNGRTMAQLTDRQKDDMSHRGNAVRLILPALLNAVVDGDDNG